jgi:predicted metal-binding protein
VTLDGESVSIAVKQANLEVLKELFVCTHCGKEAPEMDKCGKCLGSDM